MSASDLAQAESRKSERSKQTYVISRVALKRLIAEALHLEEINAIRLGIEAGGKPYIVEPKSQLHFNVSHSQGRIAIGLSYDRKIGIDLEYIDKTRRYERIAEHYFHQTERAWVNGDNANSFYQLWTLKEALVKAEGRGMAIPFNAFYFKNLQDYSFIPEPRTALDPHAWMFRHSIIENTYSLSVAYETLPDFSKPAASVWKYVHNKGFIPQPTAW
ncbi:4'-phosphopantetheinyl transferase family protein [Alteromonas sediminis]|uniref:4'-phosphopantetheinyl transferase family protein n=1 Tax=Alteromonas sediminis TaxID=2259342 RepID=UPI001405276E|nr:4'-phosphopantetheinyl transferase superfamily protein [Alteromonas sediminis]